MNTTSQAAFPDLHELVKLFYDQVADLGRFRCVTGEEMPGVYQRLLDHNHHMTVTLESHHGCSVDVQVLEYAIAGDAYQRKILLSRQSDGKIVQFGIVRLHVQYLAAEVRQEIEKRELPLGRVLIEHNVMRRVELGKLWHVEAGVELSRHFRLESAVSFGRTAIIHCNEAPAIELLEIVSPE